MWLPHSGVTKPLCLVTLVQTGHQNFNVLSVRLSVCLTPLLRSLLHWLQSIIIPRLLGAWSCLSVREPLQRIAVWCQIFVEFQRSYVATAGFHNSWLCQFFENCCSQPTSFISISMVLMCFHVLGFLIGLSRQQPKSPLTSHPSPPASHQTTPNASPKPPKHVSEK